LFIILLLGGTHTQYEIKWSMLLEWSVLQPMIRRALVSHMEKLIVAHVKRLLWFTWGSNPIPLCPSSVAFSIHVCFITVMDEMKPECQ
jgi:hypothetical protein